MVSPLSPQGIQFLRYFISKTEQTVIQDAITASEIARFRLLGSLVGTQANDELSLGIHDANLIYTHRSTLQLGFSELHGLLSSGLEHYSNENAPLWHWVGATNGFEQKVLQRYSVAGTSETRASALGAMKVISEALPAGSLSERNFFFGYWFAKDNASSVKVAALEYLADCGITSDLDIIRTVLNDGDNKTTSAATDAIIRISLRDSREKAISTLYELQPTYVSQRLLAELFENGVALSEKMLFDGVGHRNNNVRRIVVELLCGRCAMSNDMAEQLITDTDAVVRYFALNSLIKTGRSFTDEEAKRIIVAQESNNRLGILAMGGVDAVAEDYWNQLRRERLGRLKERELEEIARAESIFDREAYFVLSERNFKRHAESLREAIDDQYKNEFAKSIEKLNTEFAGRDDLIKRIQTLEVYLRQGFTRDALDIICRQAKREDIGRVRAILKSRFVACNIGDLEYLRKFGEWQDIYLIIDCVDRPDPSQRTFPSLSLGSSKYQIAARAAYALGRNRLSEVLTMSMSARLTSHFIVEIPDKAFRSLSDESIDLLLRSEHDIVRKAAAIKCSKVKSKSQLDKLITRYVSAETYYYNALHWLDFGASVPRVRAVLATEKILNEEWRDR